VDAGDVLGGILELYGLIEKYPVELTRDFREKFHLSLSEVGKSVRFDEAYRLILTLHSDPESWLQASVAGWEHPVSRDFAVLADLYDLQHASKSKRRPKPYPRPWEGADQRLRNAKKKRMSPEQLRARLAAPRREIAKPEN
jgi:hypothetical protein